MVIMASSTTFPVLKVTDGGATDLGQNVWFELRPSDGTKARFLIGREHFASLIQDFRYFGWTPKA
jgi:hypothetical protein